MKVKYKKKNCEVIQEYENMLIIKYNNKAISVLKDKVKMPKIRKKKNESKIRMEDRDTGATRDL